MSLNDSKPTVPSNLRGRVIPAITIFCAIGVLITGALLFSQSRVQPVVIPITSPDNSSGPLPNNIPQISPDGGAIQLSDHTPPPTLTAGMKAPQAAVTLGNWFYDHEQWPKAIENYRRAISSGLDNPDIRTDLGNALRFIGKPQDALEQYRTAQRQNPAHEQSLYNQGALWALSMNDSKQAVAAWQLYIERFPNGKNVADAKQFIADYK
jgi:tetratricopeptide (TPR) repeat protein